ncbi:MAG TPA: LacI family DNA-binding transcriptional regulator [Bryobacteraceae bacterium]|nr:LacI family DNA-binding transcriptional regulator [Bryobacteraceae bacterium]
MPTIKEVADRAGVSVGTVSHVITGSVPVSEPLRLKVLAAIRDLDYHPNHVARSLKTSRTRTLGIIVPDMTISFFPQIIHGAEMAAREKGYSLIAVNSFESADRQRELLSLLRSQQTEGILLVIAAAPTPMNQMSRMIEAGIPVVCLDRVPDRIAVDSVSVDDIAAAEMGTDHLISMGYRRIAIMTGPLGLKNERRRLQGYEHSLERAGIAVSEDLIWQGNLRPQDMTAMCQERLTDPASRPDAIICTNGPTALGALRGMRACGLRTPEDIGFLTFDELTVDDLFSPAITTIVQPAYDIGFKAAEILLDRIENGRDREQMSTIRLPAALKVRDSSRQVSRKNSGPVRVLNSR